MKTRLLKRLMAVAVGALFVASAASTNWRGSGAGGAPAPQGGAPGRPRHAEAGAVAASPRAGAVRSR